MSHAILISEEELSLLVSDAVKQGVLLAKKEIASKRYLREKDAAEYIGLSAGTLRTMRTQSRGPVFSKIGGSICYEVTELDSYMNKHKVMSYD